MTTPIRFSSVPGGTVPPVFEEAYKTGEAIKIGSVLLRDGTSKELVVAADEPVAGIVGVSAAAAGTYPGQEVGHASQVVATTHGKQAVPFYKAKGRTEFSAVETAGTAPVVATHVGEDYGLSIDGSGDWTIDVTETTNVAVWVTRVDVDLGLYFFYFLDAVVVD